MFPSRVLPFVACIALSGCWWTSPPNDAGDEAFAANAIRTLLGRLPRGSAEVRALSRIIGDQGREAAVNALFEDPDFVVYWSNVLADDLQIQRTGPMALDAMCVAAPMLPQEAWIPLANHLAVADADEPFCYRTAPEIVPFRPFEFDRLLDEAVSSYEYELEPDLVAELLEHPIDPIPTGEILEQEPSEFFPSANSNRANYGERTSSLRIDEDYLYEARLGEVECPSFNVIDVVQAAVRGDRLDALYRAYLPIFAAQPGSAADKAEKNLGSLFLDVYLDRDPACMECHTSTFSVSDARPDNGNWDRFYAPYHSLPLPFDLEGAAFSYDAGGSFVYGGDGGREVETRIGRLFRADNHAGGLSPWGLHESCGDDYEYRNVTGGQVAAFGGVGPTGSTGVLDLADALRGGASGMGRPQFRTPDWPGYRNENDPGGTPATSLAACTGCHYSGSRSTPDLRSKTRGLTDHRLFSIVRNGSGGMSPVARTDADAWAFVRKVRAEYGQRPATELREREQAFAWFVAMSVTNHIADETLGETFVMSHGFPRNPEQANALSQLTRVVAERFSLRDALREIVLSDGFNRLPPSDPGTEPYALPMLVEPLAAIHPLAPPSVGANANSEGDFVHRHSPTGWLIQVHGALGWPAPRIAGDATAYPTQALMTGLERETNRINRESAQLSVAAFITWEREVATCEKPDVVFSGDVHELTRFQRIRQYLGPEDWEDWIDRLAAEALRRGWTWEQVALALKDRLLAEPTLTPTERTLLEEHWQTDLSGALEEGSGIEDRMRSYCGVLMSTPEFLLVGPRTRGERPIPGFDPVCLKNEICDEDDLYEQLAAWAERAER